MEMNTRKCKFNAHIDCFDTSLCKKCGWNPDVEAKRKAKLKKKIAKSKKWIVGEKKG